MKRFFQRALGARTTKAEQLFKVLSDQRWHSTRELSRRVGHTFCQHKYRLVGYGYPIEKRVHPERRFQYQYRLVDEPRP